MSELLNATMQAPREQEAKLDEPKLISNTMTSTPKENRETSKLAEYTLFKDFPVSKLKFSLSGSLLAASSSFNTTISIF